MPQQWTPTNKSRVQDVQERWYLGRMSPVQVSYWRYADGNSEEISYDEYMALEEDATGRLPGYERITFIIDPGEINPNAKFQFTKNTIRGSMPWKRVVVKSLAELMETRVDAFDKFAERVNDGTWFVEAKEVTLQNGKKETSAPYFTRMTQSLDEAIAWNDERYRSTRLTAELKEQGKEVFMRMAMGDPAKFSEVIDGIDELVPYKPQLMKLAEQGGW